MTTRRSPSRLAAGAALVAALAAHASSVHAQPLASDAPRVGSRWAAPSRAVEGFLARYRLDALRGGPIGVDGVGGRILWSAPTVLGDPRSLAARTSLGVFGVFLPTHSGLGFSTLHAGGEVSVRPLPRPIGARLEPVISTGVGALRVSVAEETRGRTADLPRGDRTNTVFALSPGIGARYVLMRGLDLRGDVRDVLTFRGGTRHHAAYGVGLGMAF